MRYRIGDDPADPSWGGSDDFMLMTLVLSLFIGIALAWLGHRGRQMWMRWWGGGLVLASLVYLGWWGWSA